MPSKKVCKKQLQIWDQFSKIERPWNPTKIFFTVRFKYNDTHSDWEFSECKLDILTVWAFPRIEATFPRDEGE